MSAKPSTSARRAPSAGSKPPPAARREQVAGALFQRFNGVVPWEDYISEALYHPECGYYSAEIRDVGARGDFTTAPALSPLVGRALARRARQWREGLPRAISGGRPGLIEAGAGGGHLMGEVLRRLGWLGRRAWRPVIVETSRPLRELQRQRLGRRVSMWAEEPAAAFRACGGAGFLFANELADAFPPVVAEWREGRWQEVCVGLDARGCAAEVVREPGPRCAEALRQSSLAALVEAAAPRRAARAEILLSFKEWLAAAAAECGFAELVLVDYGADAETLMRTAPCGTLRAYYRHQRLTGLDVARRFGRQDITCDVNFTDLCAWGRELGFAAAEPVSLATFLRGILSAREVRQVSPASARLLEEEDAGGRFQVLALRREGGA